MSNATTASPIRREPRAVFLALVLATEKLPMKRSFLCKPMFLLWR